MIIEKFHSPVFASKFKIRGANSTTLFQVQQNDGTVVLNVDTTNRKIVVTSGTSGQSIIGSGLIVNNDAGNAAADDFQVKTNTLDAILVDASADTMTLGVPTLITAKLSFTQTDGNEYIDSLADGYLDIAATTAIRLINPTLCQDKLYFTQTDGNEYIDSLNDGYMDIGATTAIRLLQDTNITGNFFLSENYTVQFRDSAIGIYSQADTFLDIFADGAVRIGDSSAGAPTNYVNINATGNMSFAGSAGFYPRVLNQSAAPAAGTGATQCDTGEAVVWTDTDDSKCYLCYNHGGTVKTVELA